MRTILHIDFDSFFASVEEQHHPYLRDKVFGVTAQHGRSCIIASSKEAKKYGIKTGSRTYEAKKLYPNIVFIPADFPKYWEVSKKFLRIASDYTPYVELFSIDEVFMDITSTKHLFGGTKNIIDSIRIRIRQEIGEYVTVSVGISYNKLLAKLASGLNKPARHASKALRAGPNGLVEIKPEDVEHIYAKAQLTDVCGIGERVKLRLNNTGVYSLLDLRATPLPILIGEFGRAEGHFLKQIAAALDDSPIVPYSEKPAVKSVGRNYCLPRNTYDKKIVLQNIFELCEEVALELRRLNKTARTVTLSLRGDENFHMQKTGETCLNTGKELFSLCLILMRHWRFKYVRMISVTASTLEEQVNAPLSLFDQDERKDKLTSAIDAINDRFGDHTIRNGFLLYADKLTTVPNGYMADKYERTKLAQNRSDLSNRALARSFL